MQLAGCVLAGGHSSRMGRDKSLLRMNGRSMHAVALDKLSGCTEALYTSGERVDPEEHRSTVLKDPYGCGPLGGIVVALEAIEAEWVLFLPIDMPLVPQAWMERLAALTRTTEASAILTRTEDGEQSLVAAYRTALLPDLKQAVEAGRYKVTAALPALVQWQDATGFPPEQFRNLNTPGEVSSLRALGFDIS